MNWFKPSDNFEGTLSRYEQAEEQYIYMYDGEEPPLDDFELDVIAI